MELEITLLIKKHEESSIDPATVADELKDYIRTWLEWNGIECIVPEAKAKMGEGFIFNSICYRKEGHKNQTPLTAKEIIKTITDQWPDLAVELISCKKVKKEK